MSWDIFMASIPTTIRSIDEMPNDAILPPLGSRADVIAKILEVVPDANFSDPSWGLIDTPGFSIEVNLGSDEVVDCLMLHVRGDDTAVGCVAAIIERLGVRAIDTGTGDFLDAEEVLASLRRWRAYRDRVIGSGSCASCPPHM